MTERADTEPPLCVDLDGTLIRSDTLIEAMLALRPSWHAALDLARGLRFGRAAFKARVAALVRLDPASLPYHQEFLDYLRAEHARGRTLVLVTAADIAVAQPIADHLGIFDSVLASDGRENLKGPAKARALVARFGERGFCYAGNSRADLAVWAVAKAAIVVNAPASVAARVARMVPVERHFRDRPPQLRALVRTMRPHQWAKNLLVFVPVVGVDQGLRETATWLSATIVFLAFSAVASAIYIVNDLGDLGADRAHPRKRFRPLASGALSIPVAITAAAILLAGGIALGAARGVLPVLVLYVFVSVGYTFVLKELPLVDIFALATLYTLRLFAGGVATGYFVSLWLLGFSGFLFLSLATLKRVEELMSIDSRGDDRAMRRGYRVDDRPILQIFGCCSAFVSSLVLALFVQSETAARTYADPALLWGAVPLMLFWQCRLWLSTARGYMHDDPIVYAARDWVSWCVGAVLVMLIIAARVV